MAVVSIRCSTMCLTGGSRLLTSTTALYFRRSFLATPTCQLVAGSLDELLLGASSVGFEGEEGGTAGGGAAPRSCCWVPTLLEVKE